MRKKYHKDFTILLVSVLMASCEANDIGKCTHIPLEGVATIVTVEERSEYQDCGIGVLLYIDLAPDHPIYAKSIQIQNTRLLTLYPKRWIEAVGLIEGSQHRCIYYARGGPCPNYIVWENIDVESIEDSCAVWAAELH